MSVEMFGLQAKDKPLKGKFCKVPSLTGGRWFSVVDQSPCGGFIRAKRPGARPHWIAVKDAIQICDGRKDAKRSRI
jgi:hypothetical protein